MKRSEYYTFSKLFTRWYYVAELSRNISGAPDFLSRMRSKTFLFYYNISPDRTEPYRVSTS